MHLYDFFPRIQEYCHVLTGQIDLRLRPEEKPKSPELLKSSVKKSPLDFLLPLYDSYPGPVRTQNMENPRMSPAVASVETLPENILLVVAGMDIIVHEQLAFVERLKGEIAQKPQHASRKIEALYMKGTFHGFLDCESKSSSLYP